MAKSKRKPKKKEDRTDGFLTILFFLFTLYLSILGGIISVINKISSQTEIGLEKTLPETVFSIILLGAGVLVGFYLLSIIFVGVFELQLYYKELNSKQEKVRLALRKFVLNTPSEIVFGVLPFALFILVTLIFYFEIKFALIMIAVYIITLLFTLYQRPNWGRFISSAVLNKPRRNGWTAFFIIFYTLIILSLMFIAFNVVTFNFAKFDINFDKEGYTKTEDVYITIYTRGIVKPIADDVTYSNVQIPLNYTRNKMFGSAPIYVIIPSTNLTEHPYNSYITIKYHIPYSVFIRGNLTQEQFVPVFNSNPQSNLNTNSSSDLSNEN